MWKFILTFAILFKSYDAIHYDSYTGEEISDEDVQRHAAENTTFWCTVNIEPCDPDEPRRLDGSCNNFDYPTMGAMHTPQLRLLPADYDTSNSDYDERLDKTGNPLPNPRWVRTMALQEGRVPDTRLTQLATHFFLGITADVVAVHDTVNYMFWTTHCCLPGGESDKKCAPIKVPNDDPVLRFSDVRCLNHTKPFTFQSTGCIKNKTAMPPERVTTATPLYDLSVLYGSVVTEESLTRLRLYSKGLLKYEVEDGRVWPPSFKTKPDACGLNEGSETRCHLIPDDAGNSLFGINLMVIWFWRNHNRIATELASLNPCWSDERLFYTARDINIATAMQIFLHEFLPILFGQNNLERDGIISPYAGHRDTYQEDVLAQLSVEYTYVLRWGHIMQEGRLKMYDTDGCYLKQIPITNMTYRTGYFAIDDNIDYITQGVFRQAGGRLDYTVDPDISEVGLGGFQRVTDLTAFDLHKGRLFGFPPYVKYKKFCSGKTIKTFDDLAEFVDPERIEILKDIYNDVEDMDLLTLLWFEKPLKDGVAPPTFYCVVAEQLIRSITSDRHWYERPNRPNAFTLEQLLEIRKASISRFVCDVGDKVTEIQPRAFFKAGKENKIASCDNLEKMDLTKWKDPSCMDCKRM